MEGEKLCNLHRFTENSLAYSDLDQMHACICESSIAGNTSDQPEIAASSMTAVPVFPSSKLSHHSSDSSLVAVTIKVPVIIHSWPDEQRKAQLVTGS